MRLPFLQAWRLRGIERTLRRSEPHMAAMLAIFTRLNAGEAIASPENARWPGNRPWRVQVHCERREGEPPLVR